jgi:hypothetical protein
MYATHYADNDIVRRSPRRSLQWKDAAHVGAKLAAAVVVAPIVISIASRKALERIAITAYKFQRTEITLAAGANVTY